MRLYVLCVGYIPRTSTFLAVEQVVASSTTKNVKLRGLTDLDHIRPIHNENHSTARSQLTDHSANSIL